MAKQDYAGKIRNTGPQEVQALHSVKSTGGSKAIRGTDLRSGK